MRVLKCAFTFHGATFGGSLILPDDYFDSSDNPNHRARRQLGTIGNVQWGIGAKGEPLGSEVVDRKYTDAQAYCKEKFSELFAKNPDKALEIQAKPLSFVDKSKEFEKELSHA